jgi:hypothetical protein
MTSTHYASATSGTKARAEHHHHHQPSEDTMANIINIKPTKPVDHIFEVLNRMKPTKPVDHCMHVAALHWAQAAFYDGLDAEAVRRGHINTSIKFAHCAQELRFGARNAEAGARGIELEP